KVFLHTPADVHRVIGDIERNPVKEGLDEQRRPFVTPYDGWPHASRRRDSSRRGKARRRLTRSTHRSMRRWIPPIAEFAPHSSVGWSMRCWRSRTSWGGSLATPTH